MVVVGQAVNDVVHLVAEIVENATTFSPEDTQVYVSGQPLSSGGVLLDITDNGVGISDQEMSHANWRLDNPPVVDVAVSRRMGLFVVGRLAARHGVRVRLRHAQAGGLTALIWLPDTVAAPEVAPPLGRLRRFEAEDFGPAASLSAPTQAIAPSAASQATAAARIPRFSPTQPTTPATPAVPSPAAPSFSPVAGAGTPAQQAQADSGPQADEGSTAPAVGLGDGGLAAARNGWDVGGDAWGDRDRDESTPQALPVRNGTANGKPAGDNPSKATPFAASASPASAAPANAAPASAGPANADTGHGSNQGQGGNQGQGQGSNQGQGQPAPNGPRLPAFTGLSSQGPQFPIGSQNVHGSDGPSASDPASPAGRPAAATNGQSGQSAEDPAGNSGQVTIPPAGAQEPRLPIFDSLESDWFRRSGQTMTATQQRPQGAPATQGAAGQQTFRTSPADEGWKAAQAVASPEAGETTGAGLPRRVPRANLVPGSVASGGGQEPEAEAPVRSPDAIRNRMASFQRGVREGRAVAPQTEEP
jgi:hypothetical protein